jgi:hypothetical protein
MGDHGIGLGIHDLDGGERRDGAYFFMIAP